MTPHATLVFAPLWSVAAALALALSQPAFGGVEHRGDLVARIRASVPRVTASATAADTSTIEVATRWQGEEAVVTVRNRGSAPMALAEVVLFDLEHGLPAETAYYGEGLQMLAQYGGSLAAPVDYGEYPDRSHYRLPEPEGFRRVYSMALLEPSDAPQVLLGFTSCRRFVGAFDLSPTHLRGTIDLEGTVIPAGKELALEGLLVREGSDRAQLLGDLAARLARAHPRTAWPAP